MLKHFTCCSKMRHYNMMYQNLICPEVKNEIHDCSSRGEGGWRFRCGLLFKYECLLDIFCNALAAHPCHIFPELHMGQHDLLTFTNSSGWVRWHSIKRNTSTCSRTVSTAQCYTRTCYCFKQTESTFAERHGASLFPLNSIAWKLKKNICSRSPATGRPHKLQ